MPGRGSYGKGGKWIYQRAKHIRSKNPDMDESTSFAIATQQAHKVGKSPKRFRTSEGVRTALTKMRRPVEDYKKTAAVKLPKGRWASKVRRARKPTVNEAVSTVHIADDRTKEASMRAFFDELEKISQAADPAATMPQLPSAAPQGAVPGVQGAQRPNVAPPMAPATPQLPQPSMSGGGQGGAPNG